ncbi:MAG TPA: SGNH/GDSL hydrolase family protein [Actinomycetota bacterium]|nr:SGNH/GDSL hydrolase family protein [Actinomycetota bacterium]
MRRLLGARLLGARLLGAVLLVCSGVACTSSHTAAGPRASPAAVPLVYVAVGASESVGVGATDPLRNAWTQVFYRSALPRSAVFVNMAVSGSTTADALANQVPTAVGLSPDVVSVWLNVNDLIHGVTPASYEADLTKLVSALRRGGRTRVLLANTPPLDDLPAYLACLRTNGSIGISVCSLGQVTVPAAAMVVAAVDAYNAAIARVAAATGATVVDLHAVGLAARKAGTEASLVGNDGFHPSDAGHALVAKAFATAYRGAQ